MKKYKCKLKSRAQMEKDIPREKWGWWIDICPGKTLMLRHAEDSDLKRCNLPAGDTLKASDFMCELSEHGSLVSKEAIKHVEVSVSEISRREVE